MIKDRKIFRKLLSGKGTAKVSIILGPRQVGKTTALKYLYESICAKQGARGIFLDLDVFSNFEKVSTYESALTTFRMAGYNPEDKKMFYVFLDEFQRYEDTTIVIKNIYDHHENIKVYATGSSSLAIRHKIQESLAGRKIITHLFPLDFEEFLLFQEKGALAEAYKNISSLKGDKLFVPARELFLSLEEFMLFGGYPEVVLAGKNEEKQEILKSIFDLYIKKELVEYLKIEKAYQTKKLIQYLAVNNAQKIKYQNIAQLIGFSQKTVKNYIELLKETFLIVELKPFFNNKNKELVKIPKIYFVDSGVANFFINNFNSLTLRKDAPFLLENFCLGELLKSGVEPDCIKFWQDKNLTEVDFIIEKGSNITAVEIKFKHLLKDDDFSSFHIFRRDYPQARCFLVNLGSQRIYRKVRAILPYKLTVLAGMR